MKSFSYRSVLFAFFLMFISLNDSDAGVTCANPNAGYNVSSSSSNNVPINQCYTNTVGECLYNTANPALANGGPWNTGCPASVAGSDCCRWKRPAISQSGECCKAKPNANPAYDCSQPLLNFGNPPHPQGHPQGQVGAFNRCVQVNNGASCQWNSGNRDKCCAPGIPGCGGADNSCPPPAVSIASPFQQIATNPAYAELYRKCKQEAALSGNPQSYKCCVTIPKDPCKERGLESVNPAALGIQGGYLCCNSSKPREDMMSGKKVCCEVIKN